MEASNAVLCTGGLDVCLTDTGWQAALVISSGLAHVSKGSKQGGYRQAGYAQSAVHPQNMAGRRWHSDWCAAEAHASRRYSHHDEYLWRRSDRRHASSTQQDRPLGAANFPNGLWNGLWVSVSILKVGERGRNRTFNQLIKSYRMSISEMQAKRTETKRLL